MRYSRIVAEFQQPIYRYCCRMLANRQDAEDAVQDILVKSYQRLHQYGRSDNFAAWLYRIAYRHCLNLLRKRKIHRQAMRMLRPEAASASAEQELDDRLFDPALAAALTRLSAKERNLLVLRVFEEKSYAEIGEMLGTRPNALIKRMQRIVRKVRGMMNAEEEIAWNEQPMPLNTKI